MRDWRAVFIKKIRFDKEYKRYIGIWDILPEVPEEHAKGPFERINEIAQTSVEEADMQILLYYIDGSFEGGHNKYTHALELLEHQPEMYSYLKELPKKDYLAYHSDWRLDIPDVREILHWALHTRLPKERFVITKPYKNQTAYAQIVPTPLLPLQVYWMAESKYATKFRWIEDVREFINRHAQQMAKEQNWAITELSQ